MAKAEMKELYRIRQNDGLLTISELCAMFKCGRAYIDNAVNSGKLKFMSPNNKLRFIQKQDFIEYMKKQSEDQNANKN
jgi:hypothetical protein